MPLIPLLFSLGLFTLRPFAQVYKLGMGTLMLSLLTQLTYLWLLYSGNLKVNHPEILVLQFFLLIEFSVLLVWLMLRFQVIAIREFNLFRILLTMGVLTQLYLFIRMSL